MSCASTAMPGDMTPAEASARREVRRLKMFYHRLVMFLLVGCGLLAINLIANPGRLWVQWPLLGWGLWLAAHGISTFARTHWLSLEWEENKVKKLMRKQV